MAIRKLVSLTLSVVFLAFACSKQGEGERCTDAKDNVCEDGLTCTAPPNAAIRCDSLSDKPQFNCQPYRCCPSSPPYTDSRCASYGSTVTKGTGGADAGASAGTGGESSTGGSTAQSSSTGGSTAQGSSTGGSTAQGSSTGGSTAQGSSTGGSSSTGGTTTATTT